MYPISAFFRKFHRIQPTTAITVVVVFSGILLQLAPTVRSADVEFTARGVIGGPETFASELTPAEESGSLDAFAYAEEFSEGVNVLGKSEPTATPESAYVELGNPSGETVPVRQGIASYTVEKGDTISGIAAKFGVSVSAILDANPGSVERIKPGQELRILQVSGVFYAVREGETLDDIAARFGVPPQKIAAMNALAVVEGEVSPGAEIIIPGVESSRTLSATRNRALPVLKGYFGLPAAGYNWGILHGNGAVDIANACGTPIVASAGGIVIEVGDPTQWNGGHGGNVYLEHPNGTRTRYSHTERNYVRPGDEVQKGDHIADIGNTGNTKGSTGCHVHFGVEGGANPFGR